MEQRRKRKADEMSLANDMKYWLDYRNPEHNKISWIACTHDTCVIHYSDKAGDGWFPRYTRGMSRCKAQPFDCTRDTCSKHLWDKRTTMYFPNHSDPQEMIQMQTVEQVFFEDETYAWECKQPSWHTCLNEGCDLHAIAKDFHGFGKSFLDQRSKQKDLARRLTA
jgi:hypothetical protein